MEGIVVLLAIVSMTLAMSEPNAFRPKIDSQIVNEHGRVEIHGIIREDETLVTLQHPLRATDEDTVGGAGYICKFVIKESKRRPAKFELPFEVQLAQEGGDLAVIRVKEGMRLDYERRSHYRFYLVAQDCGSPPLQSERAVVLIKVKDVDEFAPRFENASYTVYLEEGKIYPDVITLRTTDQDSSEEFHRVKNFEILTPDVPFTISPSGVLSNTEPLDFGTHHNYILKVVATDGGDRRSEPAFVNVFIKEKCHTGWQDIPTQVSYVAGSGQRRIAENAFLSLCDADCQPDQITAKVTLTTKHIGKGCDRDTYSITSQRKLCGASGDSVDLLPSPWRADWTKNLPTDDGHMMDQIFSFDGQGNAVEVPAGHLDHALDEHFTISTWMKHDFPEGGLPAKHHLAPKEHVLCMSDGEGMNRHHYALWVHGEKLVFLLRQEASKAVDMDKFKPAEFRWRIPQINDNEWHHYAISVDFPEVRLYLDGNLVLTDESNFEVIDDWPLHKTSKVRDTKLVVGACWQGAQLTFRDYFRGYLAGLSLLKGKTESERVIKCLHNCKENLDFHALSDMSAGTVVSFNSDMTEFTVVSRQAREVERILRNVTYVNARTYPTPGRRSLRIDTSVMCGSEPQILPSVESYVMVKEPPKAVIVINGAANLTRLVYEFERGLRIFHDVHIFSTSQPGASQREAQEEEDYEDEDDKAARLQEKLSQAKFQQESRDKQEQLLVDMCTVVADPPLNLFVEHLSLPTHLMETRNLEWSETNDGVVITNADKIENYENVIRNIHYYHNEPSKLSNRTLTLSCESQNGRFISNKFVVRLVALHEVHNTQHFARVQTNKAHAEQALVNSNVQSAHAAVASTSNFGMAAIIVVCVGFLLFMIILGVVRIRAAHRRTQVVHVEEKQEMEWDNSALNITVNPVEQEIFEYEDNTQHSFHDDSETDDDESSMQGDYGESSEDEPQVPTKVPSNDLEWDHSNLGF